MGSQSVRARLKLWPLRFGEFSLLHGEVGMITGVYVGRLFWLQHVACEAIFVTSPEPGATGLVMEAQQSAQAVERGVEAAAAESTAAEAEAEVEGEEDPAPHAAEAVGEEGISSALHGWAFLRAAMRSEVGLTFYSTPYDYTYIGPPKVAYHPNVRCRRGAGCTCGVGRPGDPSWPHPVIVGPMYRVGEVCVCEGAASEEEKADGPVVPALNVSGGPLEGLDLRSWEDTDILGLPCDDIGRLVLEGAIMCGVNLQGAELQGANLIMAQLQGASLGGAELQGAILCDACLQGADLSWAQLQGANLRYAQLQGVTLFGAKLQGADLRGSLLQGAILSSADLCVLPKGFLLPNQGSAGETEATEEDRPTELRGADLSVLPKGSEYFERGSGVEVSDAARPTDLTDAKASGAIFNGANLQGANLTDAKVSGANMNGADLSGADFTGATLEDATLKGATFAPVKPPERPSSGALHEAWQAEAVLSAVARAGAAADDEDDKVSSDGESEVEEEDPDGVEAKVEEALDDCMSKLATQAQVFMRTVDKLLGEVEERKNRLLADNALKDRLCKKLETAKVKQSAINNIIAIRFISPLLEQQYFSKVLNEAQREVLQQLPPEMLPTDGAAGAAGRQLLKQMLKDFKGKALSAGKAALLKRLSPIVNTCVRASSARVRPGPAVDEEQALMQPEDSAACLVQELWPALRASLEAQARHVVRSHRSSSPVQFCLLHLTSHNCV